MWLKNNYIKAIWNELHIKNFKFQSANSQKFYQSQWQRDDRSIIYLLYRWAIAIFFVILFAVCVSLQFSQGKFFIFLTNWGIMLCLITNVIAAVLVTRWHCDVGGIRSLTIEQSSKLRLRSSYEKKNNNELLPILKVYWLFHTCTLLLALIISTVYWAFLHGKMNKPMRFPAISFTTHCLNSVFMLLDFIVIGLPMRLLHTVYAMLLPIFYCLFTVVYYLCEGTDEFNNRYVYPILDWTKPGKGMATFAGVFCLYIVYGVALYLIFVLKRWMQRVLRYWNPQAVGLI